MFKYKSSWGKNESQQHISRQSIQQLLRHPPQNNNLNLIIGLEQRSQDHQCYHWFLLKYLQNLQRNVWQCSVCLLGNPMSLVFGFQGQLTGSLTMQTLLLSNHIKISFHYPFTTEWLRQLLAFNTMQHYVFIQHNRNRSAFKLLYFLIPILLISLAALSCCRQWCKPVSWTGSILRLWKGTKNISGIILTAPFLYFLWGKKEKLLVPPTASLVSSFVISYFFGCALFAPLSSSSFLKVSFSISVFMQSKI